MEKGDVRRRSGKKFISLSVLLIAVIVGVAVAFTSFSHFFPTVPVQPAHAGLTTTCGTSSTVPLTVVGTPIVGTAGTVAFTCGTATTPTPAVSITSTGPATEAFASGTFPWGGLWLVPHSSITPASAAAPCSISATGAILVFIGAPTQITFSTTGDYDYCAQYNAPTSTTSFSAFSITWT